MYRLCLLESAEPMNGRTAMSECKIYSERSVWLYVCQKFVHRSVCLVLRCKGMMKLHIPQIFISFSFVGEIISFIIW